MSDINTHGIIAKNDPAAPIGKKVVKELGLIVVRGDYHDLEQQMYNRAQKMGANAVLNVQFVNMSSEYHRAILTANAVVVE